jgi:hypothetical protein
MKSRSPFFCQCLPAALFIASLAQAEVPASDRVPAAVIGFPDDVRAVLQKHCFACHGEKKQKGDIRLDTLSIDFPKDAAAAETWHDALDAVSIGEMPPEEEPRPTEQERGILTGWIRKNLDTASAAVNRDNGGVVMRRLNNDEYRYTMTDLLGMPGKYGERLPADPLSKEGFANNGATLGMTALQIETYLESAREALGRVLMEGEQPPRFIAEVNTAVIARGKEPTQPLLGRTGNFTGRVSDPPREHDFTVRITAHAEAVEGMPLPVIQVAYGQRAAGALANTAVLGVTAMDAAGSKSYEFRGNARDFPNAKEMGDKWEQILVVTNVLQVGNGLAKVTSADKKKAKGGAEKPGFPGIWIEKIEFIGNDYPQWPPPDHRRILFAAANEGTPAYARDVLHRFLSRAWRSPVSDTELARYHEHFQKLSQQMSFVAAMRETLTVALASPRFLYLVEPRLKTEAVRPLNDYELASRLSYFLWSSMPDDALLDLAAKGKLKQPNVLAAQVERMLSDTKSQRFVEQFATQWLDLGGLERVAVNPQYYPSFKDELKADMAGETKAFFGEILRSGTSALQFLDSDWTMLNAPLSKHYGIKGPESKAFTRVSLAGTKRPGGLLGHASMHLSNSNGEDTHPIKRAVWIRERLLHDPPLPPPPNVPALPVEDPNFAKLSIREQMQIHRKDPACADCHRDIDAWGVALDHYDAVGLRRDVIRRPSGKTDKRDNPIFDKLPVDAKDILPGGVKLDGLESLKAYLINERKDQFAHALVTKLLAYSLGRSVVWSDEETVKRLTERFTASGYKLPALIADIVASEPFLKP